MSKYAKVTKGQGTWEILVLFPNIHDRAEQSIRFEYEFPGGKFEAVDYEEARRGFDMAARPVACEMCNGRTYPALIPRSIIKAQKRAAREYYRGKYL